MDATLPSLSYMPPVPHITNFSAELLHDIGAYLPLGSLAAFALVSRTIKQTVQPALNALGKATGLLDLPSELIVDIASYLPLGSLAAFSLTSRDVRELVQPVLYRKLELCCDGPKATQFSQRARVRRVLTSIAEDPERCEMLRELDLREFGWMGQKELARLRLVVERAQRLEAIELTNASDASKVYFPFFPPVWDVILVLPALETLDCRNGPVVSLQLQRMRSLRRLKVADYRIIASEDGSLPPLEYLELDFVTDITEDWLASSLLRSLKTLKLKKLMPSDINEVSKMFTTAGKTSTIDTLVLDLGVGAATPPPLINLGLHEIITGAMHLPLLRSLAVFSFSGNELESTLQVFERAFAAHRASHLEHFVLGVGGGRPNVCSLSQLARLHAFLALLPQLQTLETDLTGPIKPLDQAKDYFAAHRGLIWVMIPCCSLSTNSAEAFTVFVRDAGGAREVMRMAL